MPLCYIWWDGNAAMRECGLHLDIIWEGSGTPEFENLLITQLSCTEKVTLDGPQSRVLTPLPPKNEQLLLPN